MKVGDKVELGKYKATIMSMEKPPGFGRRTKVTLKVEFDLEDFENEFNKKSTRRVKGKKAKAT